MESPDPPATMRLVGVTTRSDPLDAFTYTYADATPRITGITSTQGPAFAMSYYGPTGDELLQQITATTNTGGSLNQFGYIYNADDLITSFSVASPSSQTTTYIFDKANRLISASGSAQDSYGYDAASNILSMTGGGTQQNFAYTSTNAISSGAYDPNGSPLSLGGVTYAWDGANRLVSFAEASGRSSTFTYDGLGHLVRIVDQTNGTVTADHSYFWCGAVRCLAHDNTQSGSPVSTQYFSQGMIAAGVSYYYERDKLGSVRELVTASGGVAVQYDYDPYGNPTTLSGSGTSDVGYAGYFHHAASGLDFTMYRAYDPSHARWSNRDPAGEVGGINRYAYARGNPLRWSDPLGLCPPGYDPTTGGLNGQTQAALDTWNNALDDVANDVAAGNQSKKTDDIETANWAAAKYDYYIGQGPNPGVAPDHEPPPSLPPPQLAPVPISPLPIPPISID
jgi:RHS repeat-associated protein